MAYELASKEQRPPAGVPPVQVAWDTSSAGGRGVTVRVWVGSQAYSRYVPATGVLTVIEASVALGSYPLQVYRLAWARRIRSLKVRGVLMIPLSEVKRIRGQR